MPVVYHRDRPVINSASGHPSLSMVVNRDAGSSQLSVWVSSHAPDELVPLHTHGVEEVLTFVGGEGVVTVGTETFPIHADMSVIVPPGVPHGYQNTGRTPLRIVITMADADAKLGKRWEPAAEAVPA